MYDNFRILNSWINLGPYPELLAVSRLTQLAHLLTHSSLAHILTSATLCESLREMLSHDIILAQRITLTKFGIFSISRISVAFSSSSRRSLLVLVIHDHIYRHRHTGNRALVSGNSTHWVLSAIWSTTRISTGSIVYRSWDKGFSGIPSNIRIPTSTW